MGGFAVLRPVSGFAQQLTQADWERVHVLTVEAMNELYNLRFAESEAKCGEVMKLAPQDPRGYFFRAMVYYYRNLIYRERADYEKFLQVSGKAIQVCEALLKNNPNDSKTMFYMGGLQGYRGMLHVNNDELSKAIWEGKKGYDMLKSAAETDPNNVDAQMGLGLFGYMISQAPSFVLPALKLAGLKGDRVGGLKMLEAVAAKGTYARYEAMYWLSNFYRGDMEQQYDRAAYYLNTLMTQFPNNDFYRNAYGALLLFNLRKADKAIAQYQSIVSKAESGAKVNAVALGQAYFRLGVAYMYKTKFSEAEQWLQKCISHAADTVQVRNAHHNLGLCLEVQGNHAAALPHFQKSTGVPRSVALLKTPLTPHEIYAEKQTLLFNAGDFDASFALGEQIIASVGVANDVRAEALYLQARALYEKGDYQKAEEKFAQAAGIAVSKETWLPPLTRYRLGLAQIKLGKKQEAKSNFEQALSYEKYTNDEFTKRLIQKELARLKNL